MANYRNPRILRAVTGVCKACFRQDGTTVMAHSNRPEHGKGMGIKAHDVFVAELCHKCHAFVDQGSGPIEHREHLWESAHRRTLPQIWDLAGEEGQQLLSEAAPK